MLYLHLKKVKTQRSICSFYLLNVLLCFVVFLCQILGRGLAGDLDEGQLLAVPGHVAGRLAHTEIVVLFHQEIWGGRETWLSLTFGSVRGLTDLLGECVGGLEKLMLLSATNGGAFLILVEKS